MAAAASLAEATAEALPELALDALLAVESLAALSEFEPEPELLQDVNARQNIAAIPKNLRLFICKNFINENYLALNVVPVVHDIKTLQN